MKSCFRENENKFDQNLNCDAAFQVSHSQTLQAYAIFTGR